MCDIGWYKDLYHVHIPIVPLILWEYDSVPIMSIMIFPLTPIHIHIIHCMYIYIYIYTHTYIYIYIHVYIYIYVCMYIHIHVHTGYIFIVYTHLQLNYGAVLHHPYSLWFPLDDPQTIGSAWQRHLALDHHGCKCAVAPVGSPRFEVAAALGNTWKHVPDRQNK